MTTQAKIGKKHKRGTVLCATKLVTIKAGKKKQIDSKLTGSCLSLLRTSRNHQIKAKFTARFRSGQQGLVKNIALVLG